MRAVPRWNGAASVETRWGASSSPVFSTVSTTPVGSTLVVTHTAPCSGRLWTIALCTRFVVICCRRAGDPMVGARSPEVLMVTPALLGEGQERLGGFLCGEGQVDALPGEGPLVGAAEEEQRLGEVDRSGVDVLEAVDEGARVAVRILAGHVEKGPRDRQRGAQLVRGVGREPLLLRDMRLEPRQHAVEGIGQLPELVVAALELDPVGERPGRGPPGGVHDAAQRGEHPAGENPPSREREGQQERQRCGRPRSEGALEVGPVGNEHPGAAPGGVRGDHHSVGHVAQQEHPHDREQQGTGEHEERGVAEGELETNAQTRGSIHGLLARVRCRRVPCRCGSRRRPRWR